MRILGKTTVDKDFLEISFSELISITGGVIAGTFLVNLVDGIGLIGGLFILFPGLLEMHGNIYGSLSARLSNLLILGKLRGKREIRRAVLRNAFAVLVLALVVSFILGLITYNFVYFIFSINTPQIVLVSVLSSLLSAVFEIPLVIYTTFWVFRHRLDPEDIMGPYVTTLGDIISIISLVFMIRVLI